MRPVAQRAQFIVTASGLDTKSTISSMSVLRIASKFFIPNQNQILFRSSERPVSLPFAPPLVLQKRVNGQLKKLQRCSDWDATNVCKINHVKITILLPQLSYRLAAVKEH